MNESKHVSIWAVTVSYNGGRQLRSTFVHVVEQVDHVIIIDNASDAETRSVLQDLASEYKEQLTLIANGVNRGLAAGLNQGIREAIRNGADWVLTLDQDSELGAGMVAELLSGYASLGGERARAAVLAPTIIDARDSRTFPASGFGAVVRSNAEPGPCPAAPQSELVPVQLAYTSGSLVRADVFASIGDFREDFFIDQVDFEFCLRVRANGFGIFMSPRAKLFHRLGTLTVRQIAGFRFRCTTYAAVRHYYCARNKIVLFKSVRDWRFIRNQAWVMVKDVARIALFEDAKLRKAAMFVAGVFDGIRGKMGECAYFR